MKTIYLQIFVILLLVSKLLFFDKKKKDLEGVKVTSVRAQNPVYSVPNLLNPNLPPPILQTSGLEKTPGKPDYRSEIILRQQEEIKKLKSAQISPQRSEGAFYLLEPEVLKNQILTNSEFLTLPPYSKQKMGQGDPKILASPNNQIFLPFYREMTTQSLPTLNSLWDKIPGLFPMEKRSPPPLRDINRDSKSLLAPTLLTF